MAKRNRNRESSSGKARGCLIMNTCKCSWKGGTRCTKKRCNYYKDPMDPKNNKK